MLAAFALLILALLAKDATPLGDRFVLRAVAEGTALLVGCAWFLTSGARGLTWRHAVLALYVGVLVFALPGATNPWYVSLQILALVSVVLFSVAFLDAAAENARLTRSAVCVMLAALTVVCIASLIVRQWHPELTYEQTLEGPRFRGLFSKPAMMGAASGLLLGLGCFVPWNWGMRSIAIVASLPCLALTGSRTFWIAGLAALIAASVRYVRWTWMHVSAGVLLLVIAVCVGIAADLRMTAHQQAILFRQGSIDTFSGRTSIWTQALQQYWEAPWLGHGFTAGGLTLDRESRGLSAVASSLQAPLQGSVTLHNGYVQALLDSGGIGALLYVAIIVSALFCYGRYDRDRQFAAEFYCLLFLAIANLGETVIFGAGVLHGVWFWYVTVLALTLPSLTRKRTEPRADPVADDGLDHQGGSHPTYAMPVPARRYPIVQSKEIWS
jgi:O-antigen ligase